MTKQKKLYNKLIEEFPQLEPYARWDEGGKVRIGLYWQQGPHWDTDLYVSAIVISKRTIWARWASEALDETARLHMRVDDLDAVIYALRLHIDQIMKMIKDFEETVNLERDFAAMRELGFICLTSSTLWVMHTDDVDVDIFSPVGDYESDFSWRLSVTNFANSPYNTHLSKSFVTLDDLLEYLVNGGN